MIKANIEASDVITLLKQDHLRFGPPPNGKYKSEIWDLGMNLIYWPNGQIFQGWFYCDRCGWIHFLKSGSANLTLRKHSLKHKDPKKMYQLTEEQLREFGHKATKFGSMYGRLEMKDGN